MIKAARPVSDFQDAFDSAPRFVERYQASRALAGAAGGAETQQAAADADAARGMALEGSDASQPKPSAALPLMASACPGASTRDRRWL